MRPSFRYVFAAVVLVGAACSDNRLMPGGSTGPALEPIRPGFSLVAPPTVCPTVEQSQKTVDTLLPHIFGPGQGRRGKAQGYSNNIVQARRNGDTQLEQAYVDSLINYTLENYYAGNLIGGQSEETQIRVLNFFYAMYCASSIHPIPDLSYIFTAENTKFIRNSTPTTVVSADSAAVQVEQGEVPADVFGTFVSVIRTNQPLPTSLDWYGVDGYKQGAFEFISNPPVTFTSPVLTGVCIQFDDAIVSATDLRIAHGVPADYVSDIPGNYVVTTAGGTIEVTAYADPSPLFLDCAPLPAPPSASRLGRVLQQFAKLFVPTPLYAGVTGGSTGGTVRKFSPFAAVDTKLDGTGSGPSSPVYIPVGDTATTAPVSVSVTTRNGANPLDGITVNFTPAASFSPSSGATNASGTVGSTWTLVEGTNTGSAEAPQPLTFAAPVAFSVNVVQLTPLSTATTSLPDGQQYSAYGPVTLAGSGGSGSYAWALAPGSSLPAGLALSSGGVLSGTPTVYGSFSFTVRVTSGPLTADQALTVNIAQGYPTAFGSVAFDPSPSASQCYALNTIMVPAVAVKVLSTTGEPMAGVRVDIIAVTNNGAKVAVSQPFAISGADGRAVFDNLSINKTGAYRLIAGTQAPWPVTTIQSGRFNISPAC